MHPGEHSTTIVSSGGQRVPRIILAPAGLTFSVIARSNGPGRLKLVSHTGTLMGKRFSTLPLCTSMKLIPASLGILVG
jgi:hypothetical protein